MKDTDDRRVVLRAKYYANANCEAATGFTARALRQIADSLGVKVHRQGRRWWIDADEFDAAVQRKAERVRATLLAGREESHEEAVERICREVGLTRKVAP